MWQRAREGESESTTIKINYININVPPAINVSAGRWTAAELKVIWHTLTHTLARTHRNPQPQVDNNEYLIKWPERYLAPFKFRERKKEQEQRAASKTWLWAKFTFVLRPRSATYRYSYCCCSPSFPACWAQKFHFNYQHECGQSPQSVS